MAPSNATSRADGTAFSTLPIEIFGNKAEKEIREGKGDTIILCRYLAALDNGIVLVKLRCRYLWLSRTGRPRFQGCRRGKDALTFIVREKIGGISVRQTLQYPSAPTSGTVLHFSQNIDIHIDFHRKSNRCRHCRQDIP
ncbi:hypothetical protein CDAR_198481 [Caerostris darwini]|uniref:Uncharacterized protein n=1 Tax=Caerostris darwini TaxID=1538125 RepID=A0AAV4W5H9_9ARAC|nr:hypothetical protein CDAR_198481 [Caerostris darwini]